MQPFKKFLASIGVGTAKIDTQLETMEVQLGGQLKGNLVVTGGEVDQEIDDIYLAIKTKYKKPNLETVYYTDGTVCEFKLTEGFTIGAGETKSIPFAVTLPLYTPITEGLSVLWVKTELAIHHSASQEDEDFLIVKPLSLMQDILDSLASIGFENQEVGCENGSLVGTLPWDTGFYQVFRFLPTTEPLKDKVEHLNVVFNPLSEDEIEVVLGIYHKPDTFLDSIKDELGLDIAKIHLNIKKEQVDSLDTILLDSILAELD